MTETKELCTQAFEWGLVSLDPLQILIGHGEEVYGTIDVRTQPKTIATAKIGGRPLKLIETADSFYQIFQLETGMHLAESRVLPWRPETYQVKLDGVRVYRLSFDSPSRVAFVGEDEPVVGFIFDGDAKKKGRVVIAEKADEADASLLLALGVLMAVRGQLTRLPVYGVS